MKIRLNSLRTVYLLVCSMELIRNMSTSMRENWDRINMRKRDRNCISWNTKNFVSSFYFLNSPFNFRICNFTLSFLFLFVLALFKHKYKHTHADCIHPCWHSYPVWALEKPLHKIQCFKHEATANRNRKCKRINCIFFPSGNRNNNSTTWQNTWNPCISGRNSKSPNRIFSLLLYFVGKLRWIYDLTSDF